MTEEDSALWDVFFQTRTPASRNAIVLRFGGIAKKISKWAASRYREMEEGDWWGECNIALAERVDSMKYEDRSKFPVYATAACRNHCIMLARANRAKRRTRPEGFEGHRPAVEAEDPLVVEEFAAAARKALTPYQWKCAMEYLSSGSVNRTGGDPAIVRRNQVACRAITKLKENTSLNSRFSCN
jgi:hypothetical protein